MIKEQVIMKILKLLVSVKSIIAFIGITFSTHAYSQEKGFEPAAVFENWGVFVGENPKQCWVMSKPENSKKTAGNVKKAVEDEPESWKMVVFWKKEGSIFQVYMVQCLMN